jgi:hypothetical protein
MKGLSVAGTAAMFLVGGGILVHGVPALHHAVEGLGEAVAQGALGGLWRVLAVNLLNALAGLWPARWCWPRSRASSACVRAEAGGAGCRCPRPAWPSLENQLRFRCCYLTVGASTFAS